MGHIWDLAPVLKGLNEELDEIIKTYKYIPAIKNDRYNITQIHIKQFNIYLVAFKYTEKEQMNEEELFFCSQCKQHKAPIKKLDLWSTPDVLILNLKRFEYIPGQYFVHR
jgi:ubiquitin C-terminal hydrolase